MRSSARFSSSQRPKSRPFTPFWTLARPSSTRPRNDRLPLHHATADARTADAARSPTGRQGSYAEVACTRPAPGTNTPWPTLIARSSPSSTSPRTSCSGEPADFDRPANRRHEPAPSSWRAPTTTPPSRACCAPRLTLRRRTGDADTGWHLKVPGDGFRTELHWPLTGNDQPPDELRGLIRPFAGTADLLPPSRCAPPAPATGSALRTAGWSSSWPTTRCAPAPPGPNRRLPAGGRSRSNSARPAARPTSPGPPACCSSAARFASQVQLEARPRAARRPARRPRRRQRGRRADQLPARPVRRDHRRPLRHLRQAVRGRAPQRAARGGAPDPGGDPPAAGRAADVRRRCSTPAAPAGSRTSWTGSPPNWARSATARCCGSGWPARSTDAARRPGRRPGRRADRRGAAGRTARAMPTPCSPTMRDERYHDADRRPGRWREQTRRSPSSPAGRPRCWPSTWPAAERKLAKRHAPGRRGRRSRTSSCTRRARPASEPATRPRRPHRRSASTAATLARRPRGCRRCWASTRTRSSPLSCCAGSPTRSPARAEHLQLRHAGRRPAPARPPNPRQAARASTATPAETEARAAGRLRLLVDGAAPGPRWKPSELYSAPAPAGFCESTPRLATR